MDGGKALKKYGKGGGGKSENKPGIKFKILLNWKKFK